MELETLLCQACSSNTAEVKAAERQLLVLRNIPGFFNALVEYALNTSHDVQSRVQAVLYLKNAIDTDWRSRTRSTIAAEEKESIRANLLTGLNEQSDMLALHLVVVISRIARLDCPHDWPHLIPTLAGNLESMQMHSIGHMRTLHAFYLIIKCMASKRLAMDVRKFRELTGIVYTPIFKLLQVHLDSMKQEQHVANVEKSIICSTFCIKSLRYLTLYGFSDPINCAEFSMFMGSLHLIMHNLLQFSAANDGLASTARDRLNSSACQIMKMMGIYIDMRPLDLIAWLGQLLEIAFCCGFDASLLQRLDNDKLTIQSLNFIRQCLLCIEYKPISNTCSNASDVSDWDKATRASQVLGSFFDLDRIKKLLDVLISHHLPLNENELSIWESDPEQFALQISDADKLTDLKSSAECLLGTVVHVYWNICDPVIKGLSQQLLSSSIDMQNTSSILRLDAVLCLLGLSASDYYDSVDFCAIFSSFILSDGLWSCGNDNLLLRVLQRRALWLCCKWIGIKFDKVLRPPFFELVVRVLNSAESDLVVQLTAVDALNQVDDFEFSREELSPHLDYLVPSIIALIEKCTEDDVKMLVVRSLSVIAERMGREMCRQVGTVLECLSQLWNTDHNLLKCQMLVLLTHLTRDMRSECSQLEGCLCAILSSCLDPNLAQHVYLIEDGLDLWQAVLEHTPSPLSTNIMQLAGFLPELLTLQSESLKVILEIIQSYVCFESLQFDKEYMEKILSVLQTLLKGLRSEAVISILKVVECFVSSRGIECSNILVHFMKYCETTILDDSSNISLSLRLSCLALWSRVTMTRPESRFEILTSPNKQNTFMERHLKLLLLCGHETAKQKLGLLSLCSCIATINQNELQLLSNQLYTISECLHNLCETTTKESTPKDVLIGTISEFEDNGNSNEEECLQPSEQDRRLNIIRSRDPVYTLPAPVAVAQALNACKLCIGKEVFTQAWSTVDMEVQKSLNRYSDLTHILA